MPRHEEAPLGVALPDQHANLIRIPHDALVLGQGGEVLEEEARRRLHPLVLDLPQADLIHDRGRQDRQRLAHLRVRVGLQVADDLVGGDAVLDGAADAVARDAPGDHVGEARGELGEEAQDGDLQGRRGVCVQAVVGLDDDEALGA